MRIAVIAAHPDDETLGCGGTLLKHRCTGDELHWVVATSRQSPRWALTEVCDRRRQVTDVAAAFDFTSVTELGHQDGSLDVVPMTELIGGLDGALTAIQRADGAAQIAYNDIPLYHFAADPGPGDLNGEGIGGVWFVVAPGSAFDAKPTAAAGTPVAAAADGKVGVTLADGVITPDAASFAVGTAYTFEVVNKGALTHEFIIEKAGAVDEPLEADDKEAELEDVEPGKATSLTWTFAEPGNYQLSCHLMDHYQRGMATNIRVA